MLSTSVSGQSKTKDSLWAVWENEKILDSERYKAVNNILGNYTVGVPDETIPTAKEMIAFAKANSNHEWTAKGYNYLSRGYYFKGDTKSSYENLQKSVEFSIKANKVKDALVAKTNMVRFFSKSELSVKESMNILKEIDSLGSKNGLWYLVANAKSDYISLTYDNKMFLESLQQLGELELLANNPKISLEEDEVSMSKGIAYGYKSLEKYDKAIEYYTKAIEKSPEYKKEIAIPHYVNRGNSYLLKKDTLSAIQDFESASEIQLNSDNNLYLIKEQNYAKALYKFYTKDYDSAYLLFNKVLEYNINTKRIASIPYPYVYMARIALLQKQYDKVISLSQSGLGYIENATNLEQELEFLKNSYTAHKKLNNIPEALDFFEKYNILKEQYNNKEKTKVLAIQEAENKFAIEKQSIDFAYQAKIAEREQQRKLTIGVFIVVLVLGIAGVLVYTNRRKRKAAQKEQLLQENYTQQLLENTESERNRIAGDLHDSVNHKLLQLKQKINQGNNIKDDEISVVINQVRSISHNLSPAMFDQIGLINSIEELCRSIAETTDLKISNQLNYDKKLTKNQELQVYRIIEESLNNIIKHSKASHAFIKLMSDDSGLELSIKDNGTGMTAKDNTDKTFNFGLHNIRQRSKAIKGIVNFISSSRGTEVKLKIPA